MSSEFASIAIVAFRDVLWFQEKRRDASIIELLVIGISWRAKVVLFF